jgi:hypothetical protein
MRDDLRDRRVHLPRNAIVVAVAGELMLLAAYLLPIGTPGSRFSLLLGPTPMGEPIAPVVLFLVGLRPIGVLAVIAGAALIPAPPRLLTLKTGVLLGAGILELLWFVQRIAYFASPAIWLGIVGCLALMAAGLISLSRLRES